MLPPPRLDRQFVEAHHRIGSALGSDMGQGALGTMNQLCYINIGGGEVGYCTYPGAQPDS